MDVVKPKRYRLFFEYPSRVSYQLIKAGLNYNPNYAPTERTTVRSGTGRTVATIDTPDHSAQEDLKEMTTSVSTAAFSLAGAIEPKSLRRGGLEPGTAAEGDVYFEQDDRASEVVLRVSIAGYAFDLPFNTPKR